MSLPCDLTSQELLKKLEKLKPNGSNWKNWQGTMDVVLQEGGVWEMVQGLEGLEEPMDEKEKELWQAKRERISNYWTQSLQKEEFETIAKLEPHAAWKQLASNYGKSKITSYVEIMKTLTSLRCTESTNSEISYFVRQHEQLLDRSIATKFPPVQASRPTDSEEMKTMIKHSNLPYSMMILNGLPTESKWETFRTAYEKGVRTDWDPRTLLDRILVESNDEDKEIPKLDRFSLLPTELLDWIFELAHYSNGLPTHPPTKGIVPSYDRPLYRSISIKNERQLDSLHDTFKAHPEKALYVKYLTLSVPNPSASVLEAIFTRVTNLVKITSAPETSMALNFAFMSPSIKFKHLKTCRMPAFKLRPTFVKDLRRISDDLRDVELFWMAGDEIPVIQGTQVSNVQAPQVTRLHIVGPRRQQLQIPTDPTSLLRYFPSAKIVTVDLFRFEPEETFDIESFITPLTTSLETLRLYDHDSAEYDSEIITNLSDFSLLQELHLGRHYSRVFGDISDHLLQLNNLVHLSLELDRPNEDLQQFFKGPRRLPQLEELSLNYGPMKEGRHIDLKVVEEQKSSYWSRYDTQQNGKVLLEENYKDYFSEMEDWELPLGEEYSMGLCNVERMESSAEELGITVYTNVNQLQAMFHRQLVEYFNRQIIALYVDGHSAFFEEAYDIVEFNDVELPNIEIDLSQEFIKEDVECFKVEVNNVIAPGKISAYNLRYKPGKGPAGKESTEE